MEGRLTASMCLGCDDDRSSHMPLQLQRKYIPTIVMAYKFHVDIPYRPLLLDEGIEVN